MPATSSLFAQTLQLLPRDLVAGVVRRTQSDFGCKGFTTYDHLVAMLFCQLAQARSLREISLGMKSVAGKLNHLGLTQAPARSTLAYANAHRRATVFGQLFVRAAAYCRGFAPGKKRKFRFKNRLLSLDSTTIDLCLSLFPWAKFRQTKGAVKLHLLLDHDGYFPAFALVTDGKAADVTVASVLPLAKESIVVMDRGYNDYTLFHRWTQEGVYFVTRMKAGAQYDVVAERPVPDNSRVISDEIIRLTGTSAPDDPKWLLRRIVVWDEEQQRELVFLTNLLHLAASTIAEIYRDRWEIELFFKLLKQQLRIKSFVGTSENALKVQLWTALLAVLLLKFMAWRSQQGLALCTLVALLRWNLFSHRDLFAWLADPGHTPPLEADPQPTLGFLDSIPRRSHQPAP